jgi:D-beta-D-heptose 7-phosphate kinase/D-beta-D-heptose 1-phosphate adenosyltransferase
LNKIKSAQALKKILTKLKKKGKKIVFTNGCFDILHPGHIAILRQAKQKGDVLVVGINSDASSRKIKGNLRPILDSKARALNISALEYVDYVVLFNDKTPYTLIRYLRPHYLVKGSDWKSKDIIGKDLVEKVYRVKLVRNYSTTSIINKIIANWKRCTQQKKY